MIVGMYARLVEHRGVQQNEPPIVYWAVNAPQQGIESIELIDGAVRVHYLPALGVNSVLIPLAHVYELVEDTP